METKKAPLSIVSEISLTYRPKVKSSMRPQVSCSRDVYSIFRENWDENILELQEEFKILLLNRASRVIGMVPISSGGLAGTVADPKLIFSSALLGAASSVILAHNHPSGNLKPSQADINLTRKLKMAGEYLDIAVLDHLILTAEAYFSFADEGMI